MSRRTDQLDRIEAAAGQIASAATRIEETLRRVEETLATLAHAADATQDAHAREQAKEQQMNAALAADVKAARSSAEAAFAGVQALAAVATAKPGVAELVAAVTANTEAVREMHAPPSATEPGLSGVVKAAGKTATGPGSR